MGTAVTVDETEHAVLRWVEGFVAGWRAPQGPESFAAHFRPMLAADVRMTQPMLPAFVGHEAFERQFVKPLFVLVPDVRGEVERWGSRGETIFIELTLHGTLAGRPVSWRVCDRVTLREGVAIERESYFDPSPLLAAVASTPRAWPRFVRVQAKGLLSTLTRRRTR
ncbi:MAG TPA: nuclear transport factor 2 family protein [Solirubrobacteraceae bacterium]